MGFFFPFEHWKPQLYMEWVGWRTRSELGVGTNVWQPQCGDGLVQALGLCSECF